MPDNRKYQTEDFFLVKVMTRPPSFIYLAALAGFVLSGLCCLIISRIWILKFSLPIAFGIMIIIIMAILKTQEKTIVIYLDKKSFFIDGIRYQRQDINNLKTYAYDLSECSRIYFRIELKSGNTIFITDTQLFQRRDIHKAQMLKRLIKAFKTRLDFVLVQGPDREGRAIYKPSAGF